METLFKIPPRNKETHHAAVEGDASLAETAARLRPPTVPPLPHENILAFVVGEPSLRARTKGDSLYFPPAVVAYISEFWAHAQKGNWFSTVRRFARLQRSGGQKPPPTPPGLLYSAVGGKSRPPHPQAYYTA